MTHIQNLLSRALEPCWQSQKGVGSKRGDATGIKTTGIRATLLCF